MNSQDKDFKRSARIFVYRLAGDRSGRFLKWWVPVAIIVAIPLVLLLALGFWALFAASAAVVTIAHVVSAPLRRRLRNTPPTHGQIIEGEGRRIDVED